jgi:hypothetical protein
MRFRYAFSAVTLGAATLLPAAASQASSHREAPFITKSPKVDATDFYMFRSYETGRSGFVTLIASYIPLQSQYGGPNFFTMDSDALYEIHIDNNGDAAEDITFQFRFTNTLADTSGFALPIGTGANQKTVAVPLLNLGPITAADTSKLNVSETYTLKVVRGDRRTGTAADVSNATGAATTFKKPVDYIGSKSLGNAAAYKTYADTHVHTINVPGCTGAGKVFVGQRAESFAVNLGTVFDLINAPLGTIVNPANRNALPNPIAANNVTTIALELPIACLTTTGQDVIGGWTSASVRQARVINPEPTFVRPSREGGAWAQVSRLGQPLVNEAVIGIKDKDRFNSSEPSEDAQFLDYVTHPTLPTIIEVVFGAANAPAPTAIPRNDLVDVFLKGVTGVNANGATAEYLRLNTALPATAAAGQNDLGAAACFPNRNLTPNTGATGCDVAGFPNGRRPGDDIVDVALRVMMGYLVPAAQAPAGAVPLHDAVLQNQSQFDAAFPYLKVPNPGS